MKSFHVQSVQMHCSIQNDMQSFSCSYCKCSPSMKMNRALIMTARFSPLCVLLASLLNAGALRSQSEGCSDRAAWVFLSRAGRAQGPLASSAELPSCPSDPNRKKKKGSSRVVFSSLLVFKNVTSVLHQRRHQQQFTRGVFDLTLSY